MRERLDRMTDAALDELERRLSTRAEEIADRDLLAICAWLRGQAGAGTSQAIELVTPSTASAVPLPAPPRRLHS